MRYRATLLILTAALLVAASRGARSRGFDDPGVDLSAFNSARSGGIVVRELGNRVSLRWPIRAGEWGGMIVGGDIQEMGVAPGPDAEVVPILRQAEPIYLVIAGSRMAPPNRPPGMSPFNTFFDSPASRPIRGSVSWFNSFGSTTPLRVTSSGESRAGRVTVRIPNLEAGGFKGNLLVSVYSGSPLVHVEAELSTPYQNQAYFYETGLRTDYRRLRRVAWTDTDGRLESAAVAGRDEHVVAARHRALAAETEGGSVVCFPPPHQFFFPRDYTDNLKYAWFGCYRGGDVGPFAFGIRQVATGGGVYSPWYNAPPGTKQRMGVFYLLSRGGAKEALAEALRYTHEDKFVPIPGFRTYTGHYHFGMSVAAIERQAKGLPPATPSFLPVLKQMGVNLLHVAEFHGDGHQKDAGPLRLPEMDTMFAECRRLSDRQLLMIPGEEASDYLGISKPGQHPGHWMSLFPKPVYWTQVRAPGQPFVEEDAKRGKVYHVGSREDMVALLEREHGLAWTAHPRIKASSWAPDAFRNEPFFKSDRWLGAAWKAMPSDLSRERLGERCLDLLDDMCNWGQRKYLPGEVDVFKIDSTHELYGHMNINYVRMDRVPRYDDGWRPVLDVLRRGDFFTTTGEVLLPVWTVNGRRSGETLRLKHGQAPTMRAQVEWTFPLKFAEVISGDGQRVYRERIDLADTTAFGKRTLTLHPELRGRKWVRFEVWDIAANGAYTQPIWIN